MDKQQETFAQWLDRHRDLTVAQVFHEIIERTQPPSASEERETDRRPGSAFMVDIDSLMRQADSHGGGMVRAESIRSLLAQHSALSPSPGVDAAEQKPERERLVSHSTVVSSPGSKLEVRQLHLTAAGVRAITSQATSIPGVTPSPAASADEWMAEAAKLVHVFEDAVATATCYAGKHYQVARREARAALLAHLKARQ